MNLANEKTHGNKGKIAIIVVVAVIAGLLILNYTLNYLITDSFAEGLQEGFQKALDDEEVEMIDGKFSSSLWQGKIRGDELKYNHSRGEIHIEELDVEMTAGEMLALLTAEESEEHLLNLEDFELTFFDVNSFNENGMEISRLNKLLINYSGEADLEDYHWNFTAGLELTDMNLDLLNWGEVDQADLEQIRQFLGLDLGQIGFSSLNLKLSSEDLFPGEDDEQVDITIEELRFTTDFLSLDSYLDLGYYQPRDELTIYESDIYLEFADSQLRDGLEFLTHIYEMPVEFENDGMRLSPHGPIDDLQWR